MSMLPLIYQLKSITKSLDKSKNNSDNLLHEIIDIRKEIEQSMHWLAVPTSQQQQQQLENLSSENFINNHHHESIDQQQQQQQQQSLVIRAIQNDSPQIQKLRQKNQLLKQQLQEYEFSLELIMSKYRQLILMLLQKSNYYQQNILKKHDNQQRDCKKFNIIKYTIHLQKLLELFNEKILSNNEEILLKKQEKLQQLYVEYNGLIELLKISKQFGSLKMMKNKLKNKNNNHKDNDNDNDNGNDNNGNDNNGNDNDDDDDDNETKSVS